MECAPSYVAGALLRGDQRRRPIPASILLKPTCVDTPEFQPLESGVFCAKTQPPLIRKNRGILSYNPLKFKSLFSILKKSEYEIW